MKILMVCLGNICRSPIAHGVMQHLITKNKLPWSVESNGTNGLHTGEAPHKFSIKVCKQHGIDISKQVSQEFKVADFEHYDVIYVMANDVYNDVLKVATSTQQMQKVKLFLNELYPNQNRDVTDPWYGGEDGFTEVYTIINDGCDKIISTVLK